MNIFMARLLGINEPRIIKYGVLMAAMLIIVGASLMIVSCLFTVISVPKAYQLQQITYDIADQIGDADGVISATIQRRAHNILIEYAMVPPYASKAITGTGIFLGFVIIYAGGLLWKLNEVLKRTPQQGGPGYPPQGVGSPDP